MSKPSSKLRLGVSPLTGRVYAGKIKPSGREWYAGKVDVTEDFQRCVVLYCSDGAEFEADGMRFRAYCERIDGKRADTLSNIGKKQLINLLADLLFAYANKDTDAPHSFEIRTVNKVADLLLQEYQDDKYSKEFFRSLKIEE